MQICWPSLNEKLVAVSEFVLMSNVKHRREEMHENQHSGNITFNKPLPHGIICEITVCWFWDIWNGTHWKWKKYYQYSKVKWQTNTKVIISSRGIDKKRQSAIRLFMVFLTMIAFKIGDSFKTIFSVWFQTHVTTHNQIKVPSISHCHTKQYAK